DAHRAGAALDVGAAVDELAVSAPEAEEGAIGRLVQYGGAGQVVEDGTVQDLHANIPGQGARGVVVQGHAVERGAATGQSLPSDPAKGVDGQRCCTVVGDRGGGGAERQGAVDHEAVRTCEARAGERDIAGGDRPAGAEVGDAALDHADVGQVGVGVGERDRADGGGAGDIDRAADVAPEAHQVTGDARGRRHVLVAQAHGGARGAG